MSRPKRLPLLFFALLVALFLSACGVIAELAEPVPELVPTIGDPQAAIIKILTATASTWTETPTIIPSTTATPTLLPGATLRPTQTPLATSTPFSNIDMGISVGPNSFPVDVNPLTGLPVADPSLLDRRPLAVKVTNYPRWTRPQSGLMQADMVFEYYVEFGLTRFIAIYYGNDATRVGPVRSGRFFDGHVVEMFNAIFAFKSADQRVMDFYNESSFVSRLILPRAGTCPPLCADTSLPSYNNFFVDTSLMGAYAVYWGSDNNRYDLTGFRFQSIVPWGGDPGLGVFTRYASTDYNFWQYNPEDGRYYRFQETEQDTGNGETYAPLMDAVTGQQVSANNVVILMVYHDDFINNGETEVVKINLEGTGVAYVFRDGQVYEATWVRERTDKPIQIYRAGRGTGLFPLKPGNTFFQVIGETSVVSQSDGLWRFQFKKP